MKIYYWNIYPNFGDLINPWLWPRVFPEITFEEFPKTLDGIANADSETLLVGIGTLLNERFPKCKNALVMGSGVGYGEPPKLDDTIKIYCVRGPLSAKKLSLPESYGIIDPGILLKKYYSVSDSGDWSEFSYMPQISSVVSCADTWKNTCKDLGFGYIDPRDSVENVAHLISKTGTLLTESMHGAIVAEALRIPWIPIVTRSEILSFKWQDWCHSIGLEYDPVSISPIEQPGQGRAMGTLRSLITYPVVRYQLKKASQKRPLLADDVIIDNKIEMLEMVFERFRIDYASGNIFTK